MDARKLLALIGCVVWLSARVAVAADGATPAGAPIGPPSAPITTRHTSFSIPFRVDGPQNAPRASVEVQLHMSEDRGVTWQLASRVAPDAGKFTFRAARDGEYWFMVRTLDQQGVLRPDVPPAAELKVIVDTASPQLELHVTRGEAGELHARWKSTDPHLKPDTLRITYQSGATGELWQDVAVDSSRVISNSESSAGETTWWPEDRRAPVTVRAEVTDTAGNRMPALAKVEGRLPPARDTAERVITPRPEPAEIIGPPQAMPWVAQPASSTMGNRPAAPEGPPQMPSTFPSTGISGAGETLPPPRPEPESGPVRYTAQAKPEPTPPIGHKSEHNATKPPFTETLTPPTTAEKTPPFNPLTPAATTTPAETAAPPQPERAATDLDAEAAAYSGGILPPGVRPRMVNARRFELDYDVDAVGADGVGKIELWGTRDGGRTWTSYGADEDTRSPFVVTVAGEGLFGFRMVVETTTGLRGALPKPSDLPDVWVGVDTTKPVAKLSVAEPGEGSRAGELAIRWEAADSLLAARPISLSFGQSASGPWTVFASGLENTGGYDWKLDNRVPDKIHLRLEVRDEAGNVQTVDLAEPVAVDRVRPQGKILNVRPVAK